MFAVVYFGGKQYRLREKDEVDVEKLAIEAGKNFKINEVLLLAEEDGSSLKIGMPFVAGAHVECQVLAQGKAKKILVFKFQSKKHYHRSQGHRQPFTTIKVLKISAVGGKTASPKEEKAVMEAAKEEVKEVKAVKVAKPKVAKKPAAKKPAAKKITSKSNELT